MVLPRSITTPPATSTRPPVLMRSRPTRPAIKTSHWASPPVRISPRAITISILATEVLRHRQHHSYWRCRHVVRSSSLSLLVFSWVLFPLEEGFGEPWFPNFVWAFGFMGSSVRDKASSARRLLWFHSQGL